jgi:hypothetical protein
MRRIVFDQILHMGVKGWNGGLLDVSIAVHLRSMATRAQIIVGGDRPMQQRRLDGSHVVCRRSLGATIGFTCFRLRPGSVRHLVLAQLARENSRSRGVAHSGNGWGQNLVIASTRTSIAALTRSTPTRA